jgi:hypothetical protein
MSFPSKATIEADIQSLLDVPNEAPTRAGSKFLVQEIKRVATLVIAFEKTTYAELDLGEDLGD